MLICLGKNPRNLRLLKSHANFFFNPQKLAFPARIALKNKKPCMQEKKHLSTPKGIPIFKYGTIDIKRKVSEFRSIFTNAQSLLTSKTKNCFSLKPLFEAQTAVSQIIKLPHKKTIDCIFHREAQTDRPR